MDRNSIEVRQGRICEPGGIFCHNYIINEDAELECRQVHAGLEIINVSLAGRASGHEQQAVANVCLEAERHAACGRMNKAFDSTGPKVSSEDIAGEQVPSVEGRSRASRDAFG
jgi:hypothetical protein